jgi:hypothetical protein
MNPTEDHPDVLQNIESVVIDVSRSNSAMTNYTVMRVYDTAIAEYSALARQQPPKPANLTGLDATLFKAVREICEWRLGHAVNRDSDEKIKPLSVEDLVACLKKLRKSVDFWTRERGRQGYLECIKDFLP